MTMLLTLAAGCSDNGSQSDSTTNKETNTVNSQGSAPSYSDGISFNTDASFDSEKVFKSIKINDTLLPCPFSLSDLGDEYSFGENYFLGDEPNPGRVIGNILHDGSKALSFDIYNVEASYQSDDKKLAQVKFDIISQDQDDTMNSHTLLSVNGISIGDKMETVGNTLGIPDSLSKDGDAPASYTYIDSNDTTKKIQFDFSEGLVSSITIYYNILSE